MYRVSLVQPAASGRISGGFLYNALMAAQGVWELVDVQPDALEGSTERWPAEGLVLMDSIWLTEQRASAFFALRARGRRVGLMLHSFPSMIEATENGREPRLRPSEFELNAIEQLDVVVVPGRHYADLLAGSSTRIIIAEPGIDDGWRAPPRRRRGLCRVVSVGSVTPRKGFLDVAEILAARASADVRWTVVGSLDADLDYARELRSRVRVLSDVELLGQQLPAEVQRLVRGSDLLVMPSYDENHPLVLLEAMAASVPAVAYAAGAARHMVEHGQEGLIAPIGDKTRLSVHLNRLIDDEPARLAMAEACWQRQNSLPNWQIAGRMAREALQTNE